MLGATDNGQGLVKWRSNQFNLVFCPRTELVAQIEFTGWTPDGHLRHSRFVGWSEDKEARNVVHDG